MSDSAKPRVVTRFAPSPTGRLHLGNVRTALVSFLYARQNKGFFFLRIEDTDRRRSSERYRDHIVEEMEWLGLKWDGEVVDQWNRLGRYREAAEYLVQRGLAYSCFCTSQELKRQRESQLARGEPPGYDGRCGRLSLAEAKSRIARGEPYSIRFRLGEGEETFLDLLRGELSFGMPQRGDFVILRSDGTPTYHLAVVVDDGDFGVTHVIRGEDHLSNTPRQVRLCRALGYPVPTYCHLPLVREGRECVMEKREGESLFSVSRLREMGFIAQALLDAVAMLGLNASLSPPLGIEGLLKRFSISLLGTSSPILTMEHLVSVNRAWLRGMPIPELVGLLRGEVLNIAFERLCALVEVARENSDTLRDLEMWVEAIELGPEVPVECSDNERALLSQVLRLWKKAPSLDSLRAWMKKQDIKPKEVMPLFRLALVGERHGPPLDKILALLTPAEVLKRLENAVAGL